MCVYVIWYCLILFVRSKKRLEPQSCVYSIFLSYQQKTYDMYHPVFKLQTMLNEMFQCRRSHRFWWWQFYVWISLMSFLNIWALIKCVFTLREKWDEWNSNRYDTVFFGRTCTRSHTNRINLIFIKGNTKCISTTDSFLFSFHLCLSVEANLSTAGCYTRTKRVTSVPFLL